jgi:hypothetical protein
VELVTERGRLRGCGEPEKEEEEEERQHSTTAQIDSSSHPVSQSALLLH